MLQKTKNNQLKPGMVLGQDILGRDAMVLIARGKELDQRLIDLISQKLGDEKEVLIYYPDTNTEAQERSVKEMEKLRIIVENIFSKRPDFEETKQMVQKVQKNIEDAIDYLKEKGEVNDVEFYNISKNVVANFSEKQSQLNPGLLYLVEMEKWHPETFNHSIDVAFFTLLIASALESDQNKLNAYFLGGLLHDIGKFVNDEENWGQYYQLITKTGPLSEDEFEKLKKHVQVENLFKSKFSFLDAEQLFIVKRSAMEHHEKLDGSGYLGHKKGEEISLAGRIVAIADIYDAMIRRRDYKEMIKPYKAMRHLMSLSEHGKLDANLMKIFVSKIGFYPTGSMLSSSRGDVMVTRQSADIYRPVVICVEDGYRELDLSLNTDVEIFEEIND